MPNPFATQTPMPSWASQSMDDWLVSASVAVPTINTAPSGANTTAIAVDDLCTALPYEPDPDSEPFDNSDSDYQEPEQPEQVQFDPEVSPPVQTFAQPLWSPSPSPLYSKKKPKASSEIFYNRTVKDYLFSSSYRKLGNVFYDGEIGIEIECEGVNLFDSPVRYWTAKHDGSLRTKNNHPPVEFVLRQPLPRTEISKALTYLMGNLERSKSVVSESTRTSVHVHVNCLNMTIKEVVTYICMYLLFENALVDFSGPTRVGNLFCLRAKDAEYWVWCISQMFLNNGDMSVVCSDNFRYTSCNTAALSKFGSLEFRSMRGTVDQKVIETWVSLLTHLKDKAEGYSNPMKLYEDYLKFGPENFSSYIFGGKPHLRSVLLQSSNSKEDYIRGIQEGSQFVRDIASSLPEWKVKKTKKELDQERTRPRKVRHD